MATAKYRPYFTLSELQELRSTLKERPNPRRLQIAAYLDKFISEIEFGLRVSNYNSKPSMLDKLGFSDPQIPLSHEITGEAAYNAWIQSPSTCSVKVIQEAMDWAYRNDKLTPEQESEYETQLFDAKGI